MTSKEDVNKFLNRLNELSQEFGIIIAGCGCDSSPWLADLHGRSIKDCGNMSYNKEDGYHFLDRPTERR